MSNCSLLVNTQGTDAEVYVLIRNSESTVEVLYAEATSTQLDHLAGIIEDIAIQYSASKIFINDQGTGLELAFMLAMDAPDPDSVMCGNFTDVVSVLVTQEQIVPDGLALAA